MGKYWYLLDDPGIRLWNLSSEERLGRVLRGLGFEQRIEDLQQVPENSSVLFVRGDFLFDERVLQTLGKEMNLAFQVQHQNTVIPVGSHVEADKAQMALEALRARRVELLQGVRTMGLNDLSSSFSKTLKKTNAPFVLPIRLEDKDRLEEQLFAGSYKGVTDLVTKFLWPLPAKWVTRFCANQGIRPNHVTALSFILAAAAGVLFWEGELVWGLLLGWCMTFLDTVDGKLARVTITSSWWGNIFDHSIDLIHPPLWYWAWGMGLASFSPDLLRLSPGPLIAVIVAGYIVGRLVEGFWHLVVAKFGIFLWRPFDSFFRLVTARRNPNLIFLTCSVVAGRPDIGLEIVAVWTVVSSVILLLRFMMGMWNKVRGDAPRSWLTEIDPGKDRGILAVRVFTNPPATAE